jgi:hypothetical protein
VLTETRFVVGVAGDAEPASAGFSAGRSMDL